MVRSGCFAMNRLVKNLSLLAPREAGPDPEATGAGLLAPTDAAAACPPNQPLLPQPTAKTPVPGTKTASRALNAVVRASSQVAIATHFAPTPHPKVQRSHGHGLQHGVTLTETEKIRLQVMQVQLKLIALALYDGPVDGAMSPETVAAVRHFQTLKGMRDSGVLTAGTLNALGVHPLA